jgi:flavin-dependent dehydrogenase
VRIAVVGAGPGAGAAALRLARGGADVTLYAPAKRGEKPCGGALPEHLLPQLEGFDAASLPAVVAPRARLENSTGQRLELRLDGIRIFRRRDLDGALIAAAERAGARRVPARAESLEPAGERVRIAAAGASEPYDWVVCADGARGVGRRLLGLAPEGESIGLGGSLSGVDFRTLVLGFPGAADAYLWIFPRPEGVSVGIAWSAGTLSVGAARGLLRGFLERHLPAGWEELPGPRYRYPIPVYGPWTSAAAERGVGQHLLLVGDAAAVADPLTREGIRYAALSGDWAAASLLEGEPESYPARLRRGLDAELSRAARARSLFFEDPIGDWMVPVARFHSGVRRVLADLLGCRQGYRGLRGRLARAAVGRAGTEARPYFAATSSPNR